ncbi:DNA primase [Pandoraea morbifera]|uniref:DNA primase n=1 Tax=Pandoraea morbifera TaxID=2508300 RepID=A0A5E4S277_9BURK|nr:zincin-like metallopeptidase domain-containing protein [Pandoraea morbifera]VVD69690.1 DNA primase [Pandoraea morbifera]
MAAEEKEDLYTKQTKLVILRMEEAQKWNKPWISPDMPPPYNPETGTFYKGINYVSLASAGFDDPRFYTFNNIKALAERTGLPLKLRKGSKGNAVYKAVQIELKEKDASGALVPVMDGDEPKKIWVQAYAGTVFNGSQIEGLEPYVKKTLTPIGLNEQGEMMLDVARKQMGIPIEHGGNRAYYSPSQDRIQLPHAQGFRSIEDYYSTALHEVGHATGHSSRLGRKMEGTFGTPSYAYEELVAELSSIYTGAHLGMPYNPATHDNNAAYLKSWIKVLQNDKKFIFKAASDAQRATEYQLQARAEYIKMLEKEKSVKKVAEKEQAKTKSKGKASEKEAVLAM